MNTYKTKLSAAIVTTLASLTANTNIAIAQGVSVLEEVTVTAQKREQNAQDVGIAITAYSGDQLKSLDFTETTDIINYTSGVNFTGSTAGQHKMFNIRGVAQQDYNDTSESPNAVYIDETYLAATYLQRFGMYDMERVEVLKGPQGTLFGRNATGGLGHFITNKPSQEFEAFVDVGYGSYDEMTFKGAVSGPLTDTLSARLSGMYEKHDPIYKNDFPGADDTWDANAWGVRLHLDWAISDSVSGLFTVHRGREEISTAHYQSFPSIAVFDQHGNQIEAFRLPEGSTETWVAIQQTPDGNINQCPFNNAGCFINFLDVPEGEGNFLSLPAGALGPGSPSYDIGVGSRPVPGADIDGYRDPDLDDLTIRSDFSESDTNKYSLTGATAKFTWDIGDTDMVLTSITDFKHTTKDDFLDTEGSPSNSTIFYALAEGDQWSQELRLNGNTDRMRWVAGGFFLSIENDDVNTGLELRPTTANGNATNRFLVTADLVNAGFLPVSLLPNPGQNSSIEQDTKSFSVFGQMDYDLTDTLVLTAGLRLIREEKEYDHVTQMRDLAGNVLIDNLVSIENGFAFDTLVDGEETDDNLWSGKLQLDWMPNEDLLVYGGINRGVKAGGFNAKLGTAPPVPPSFEYDPEILTAYEIGFKSTIFGGTTRLNGAVYYYDYEDNQSFQYFGLQNYVINVDAENKGVELDIISNPIDGLDLMFNVSYIDATLEDVPFATGPFGDTGVGSEVMLLDKEPAYTPELSYAGLARYQWDSPIGEGYLFLQYDFFYSDSYYTFVTNYEATEMDDHLVHNLRAGYTSADGKWGINLAMENIEDERYGEISFEFSSICGCSDYAVSGKPRWYSASIYYHWD